jgi:hypothetical protein
MGWNREPGEIGETIPLQQPAPEAGADLSAYLFEDQNEGLGRPLRELQRLGSRLVAIGQGGDGDRLIYGRFQTSRRGQIAKLRVSCLWILGAHEETSEALHSEHDYLGRPLGEIVRAQVRVARLCERSA